MSKFFLKEKCREINNSTQEVSQQKQKADTIILLNRSPLSEEK